VGLVRLRWLAVPVGLAWAALLCWRSVRLAVARLESYGPEIFARVRVAAANARRDSISVS
jgi:hypothetical protein